MKERINYTIIDGIFIGEMVNFPCICQAYSLEDLEHKMKLMLKGWLEFSNKILQEENPFEFIEGDDLESVKEIPGILSGKSLERFLKKMENIEPLPDETIDRMTKSFNAIMAKAKLPK